MLEILKIIVLTCQVGNGFRVLTPVIKYQKKCQKELIECTDKMRENSAKPSRWSPERVKKCLLER